MYRMAAAIAPYSRPEFVPRTAMHQGATPSSRGRSLLVTPRRSCTESGHPLSAQPPRFSDAQPRMGVTAEAAELGRCGAEHGAGGHCVGAALASHARSHAPAAGSAPRSRSRRCDSPHDPDSTGYREGRATSEAASASVERRSWSSVGFEYEILCSTTTEAQVSVTARPSPDYP